MSLLYKDPKDVIYSVDIWERESESDWITLEFYSDCGKHGMDEALVDYRITPLKLLRLLQDNEEKEDKSNEPLEMD
jgi:hypothetical protein